MEDDIVWWAGLALFIVVIIGAVYWHQHVESDCHAKGGTVKWLYGGKNQPDNYLCISQDGRIIG